MQLRKIPLTPGETLSRIRMLLVEDDAFTREQLARLLSRTVAEVLPAADGSEALRLFRELRPDMVLTDINMPVMDGLSMAAIIKAESPDTPVIAVTAHNEEHFLQKAIEVGIDGYVSKPIDPDALIPVLFKNARFVLQRNEDEARRQMVTYLLDINPHLIISAEHGRVDYANQTFLQFVGQDSLETLLSGARGAMNEIHVAGARHALADFSWISKLKTLPEHQHTACFSSSGEECAAENTFWVTARRFGGLDREIVTFTDITPLERERVQLLYRATTDSLTGVANRFKLAEYISSEHARFRRYNMPMCLIMFDIDHFKAINDTHGHTVGDQVLVQLAALVMRAIRDTDTLGRWGGEEFMILAPITTLSEATEFSQRLRTAMESTPFPTAGRLTCSFGVAEAAAGESLESFLNRVDKALYKAKNNGRNRVETA
ncbi:MAG: diguanylate cyclase [Acidobacteriota bacterium]